jgi:hypothetical protein
VGCWGLEWHLGDLREARNGKDEYKWEEATLGGGKGSTLMSMFAKALLLKVQKTSCLRRHCEACALAVLGLEGTENVPHVKSAFEEPCSFGSYALGNPAPINSLGGGESPFYVAKRQA